MPFIGRQKSTMDKVIQKKKWTTKRILIIIGIAMGVLSITYMLLGNKDRTLSIDRDRVSIATVEKGLFNDNIPISGQIEPIKSIIVTAAEGGNVEELFVEDGTFVKRGTPLLRLSNANLMLDFMNRETQIVEQINNLRSTRLTIEQNKRTLKDQLIDIDYQLIEAERQYAIDSTLYADSVIPKNQFDATRNNIDYLRKKKAFTEVNIDREEAIQMTQLNRIDRSIELMERNLEAIRKNLENLTIKAPIDGQLTGFNHYLGETKQKGELLGQVDVSDGFLVRCGIDEYYLNRVREGQIGTFQFGGETHELIINKVLPQVSNGQFQVEMHFSEDVPEGIRRGQTLQIRLSLSSEVEALIVKRGGFYQSTGGNWVFVLSGENTAVRREVKLGRQNTDYVEVLEGLAPGDQIITNAYTQYGEAQRLELN